MDTQATECGMLWDVLVEWKSKRDDLLKCTCLVTIMMNLLLIVSNNILFTLHFPSYSYLYRPPHSTYLSLTISLSLSFSFYLHFYHFLYLSLPLFLNMLILRNKSSSKLIKKIHKKTFYDNLTLIWINVFNWYPFFGNFKIFKKCLSYSIKYTII